MVIHDVEQRSAEWYELRLGRITGSTVQGLTSGTISTIARKKAAEILTGKSPKGFTNSDTERGIELESAALACIEDPVASSPFQQVGFVEQGKYFGYSPDGFGDKFIVEAKCPNTENYITNILAMPIKYKRQIQYGMWVCEKESCLFVNYCEDYVPNYTVQTIEFDEKYFELEMKPLLDKCVESIEQYLKKMKPYVEF